MTTRTKPGSRPRYQQTYPEQFATADDLRALGLKPGTTEPDALFEYRHGDRSGVLVVVLWRPELRHRGSVLGRQAFVGNDGMPCFFGGVHLDGPLVEQFLSVVVPFLHARLCPFERLEDDRIAPCPFQADAASVFREDV